MSESVEAGPEGWRADPYARHAERFFDGTRWTPYVRDGDTHAMDEPVDLPAAALAPSPLLAEPVLVVERDAGERRHRTVRRGDGTRIGTLAPSLAPEKPGGLKGLFAKDQFKNAGLEVHDEHGRLVATLLHPIGDPRGTVVVHDGLGGDAGRVSQQPGGAAYSLLGPGSQFVGDLVSEDWDGGAIRVNDGRGEQVARISRDLTGLDVRPGAGYVVRVEEPLVEPLRTLLLAVAVGWDAAVRPS